MENRKEIERDIRTALNKLKKSQLIDIVMEARAKTDEKNNTPDIITRRVLPLIKDFNKEHFFVVGLNTKLQIKDIALVSMGTLDYTLSVPREVFSDVLKMGGIKTIIIVHNHPTGTVEPSDADDKITRRLSEAGEIMGIRLDDSIIINSSGEFYSYAREYRI